MGQKQKAKIVNFKMTAKDLQRLDRIVKSVGYQNRADAIRNLIRTFAFAENPSSYSSATEAQS